MLLYQVVLPKLLLSYFEKDLGVLSVLYVYYGTAGTGSFYRIFGMKASIMAYISIWYTIFLM
jgi:hypothetical protein